MDVAAILHQLGVALDECTGTDLVVRSPIDGSQLASLRCHTQAEVQASIARAAEAFLAWRDVPAPQRGALVRLFGEALRVRKEPLARLVTIECGKILEEACGEVQEGSCRVGRIIGPKVAARLGRSLLELGGNNAVVVSDKADLSVALPAILFGAVGTCGQRCTTIRRVIAHGRIYNELLQHLKTAYQRIATQHIGNPLDAGTLGGTPH